MKAKQNESIAKLYEPNNESTAKSHGSNKDPQTHVMSQESPLNVQLTQDVPPELLWTEPAEEVAQNILSEGPATLTSVIALSGPSIDSHEKIANCYREDKFFANILCQPQAFKNFKLSSG